MKVPWKQYFPYDHFAERTSHILGPSFTAHTPNEREAVLLPLHRCQEKVCPELSGDGWKVLKTIRLSLGPHPCSYSGQVCVTHSGIEMSVSWA